MFAVRYRFVRLRMNQECRAAVHVGAHVSDAALGLLPILYHHVLELFVKKLFGGFFMRRIHFHEVGQYADGVKSFACPFSTALNSRFTDSVVYDRCDRTSSSESRRAFSRDVSARSSSSLRRASAARAFRVESSSSIVRRCSTVVCSSSWRTDCFCDNSAFKRFEPLAFVVRGSFVALNALDIAIDADQILIDLRELILQRRRFAQQLQHLLPGSFHAALALAKLALRPVALLAL